MDTNVVFMNEESLSSIASSDSGLGGNDDISFVGVVPSKATKLDSYLPKQSQKKINAFFQPTTAKDSEGSGKRESDSASASKKQCVKFYNPYRKDDKKKKQEAAAAAAAEKASRVVSLEEFMHSRKLIYKFTQPTADDIGLILEHIDKTSTLTETQKIVAELSLKDKSFAAYGYPGCGKSHVLCTMLIYLKDTWVFTATGTTAINILIKYAEITKQTLGTALEDLRSRNIRINHWDGFFCVPPKVQNFTQYKKHMATQPDTHQRIDDAYDTPYYRVLVDEAFFTSEARYNLYNEIAKYYFVRAFNRRMFATGHGNISQLHLSSFLGAACTVFFGDPLQLVHRDANGKPSYLSDMHFFISAVPVKYRFIILGQNRQKNEKYAKVLEKVFKGINDREVIQYFNSLTVVPEPGRNDRLITPLRKVAYETNDRVIDSLPDSIAGETHVYEVQCEVQLQETVVDEDTGELIPRQFWRRLDPDQDKTIFKAVIMDDEDFSEKDFEQRCKPVRLRRGVPILIKKNFNNTETIRNGTKMTVVGFDVRGYPIVSPDSVAQAYFLETGHYGYYTTDLESGVTFILEPCETIVNVTVPSVHGNVIHNYVCRKIWMCALPCYGGTVHVYQGLTVKQERVVVDIRHQFMPGLLLVALTRSVNPPALLTPIGTNFHIRIDALALREYEFYLKQMPEALKFFSRPYKSRKGEEY